MKKIELLAPAGDLEKLKIAIAYGADAVYIGDTQFSLRARAKNFTLEQMKKGIEYAHEHNVKVYIAANIFARDSDFHELKKYFLYLSQIKVDALIISDPGVFDLARETELEIHISTQANITNAKTAEFWYKQGAKRVICARELTLNEIKKIKQAVSGELECFVHGAMCISYSGRCLLSSFMTNRDANRGECAHPCRYNYKLQELAKDNSQSYILIEKTRPNEQMVIEEDQKGTYILNSKDLCMITHLDELIESGIDSIKIEGRVKTSYYLGTIVGAYREAINDYYTDPKLFSARKQYYMEKVKMPSHRQYCTGFYFGHPDEGQIYKTSQYIKNYDFIGLVLDYDLQNKIATVEQRNKFSLGDIITVLSPNEANDSFCLKKMYDEKGIELQSAPHPQQIIKIETDIVLRKYDMLLKACQ